MDRLTAAQRSRLMSRIGQKDTRPEMVVRRLVHALGYRYRLHDRRLPGRPDLVFAGRKKVIFVHGCFWHRHTCRRGKSVPQTRPEYWQGKFQRNVRRDRNCRRALRRLGWEVLVVWECQTKRTEQLSRRLVRFIDSA